MYVYIYLYIYAYTYTYLHIYTYVYVYICMYVCMHACMHVCIYTYVHVCTYWKMCTCMYVYMYKYIYACICFFLFLQSKDPARKREARRSLHVIHSRLEQAPPVLYVFIYPPFIYVSIYLSVFLPIYLSLCPYTIYIISIYLSVSLFGESRSKSFGEQNDGTDYGIAIFSSTEQKEILDKINIYQNIMEYNIL